MLKKWIDNKLTALTGYQLVRARTPNSIKEKAVVKKFPDGKLELILMGLIASKKKLNILQVGANDGKVNDPIYRFVEEFRDRTHIILLEPQPEVSKKLIDNYKEHPGATVLVSAIGDGQTLTLYSVKPEVWKCLHVPYAETWPEGRAATGIVSSNFRHVANWLIKHGNFSEETVDSAIVANVYETITIEEILRRFPQFRNLDVLQVDIEGSDHYAVHAALDASLRPSVINFETVNLTAEDQGRCLKALQQSGYACFSTGMDTMCIRVG